MKTEKTIFPLYLLKLFKSIILKKKQNSIRSYFLFILLIYIGIHLTFGYESRLYYDCFPIAFCKNFIILQLRVFWILNFLVLFSFLYFKNLSILISTIPFAIFYILSKFNDPYFDKINISDVIVWGLISLFGTFEKIKSHAKLIFEIN